MPSRPLLLVFLAALLLRAGLALVTERHPIFPAYAYADARLMESDARDMIGAWRQGQAYHNSRHPSQRAHAFVLAVCYRALGAHPLLTKLLNAFCGALACALLYAGLARPFGPPAALLSALLVACWPTHVFFTSQDFKEAWVMCLSYAGLACAVRLMAAQDGGRFRAWGTAAALCLSLAAAGLLRGYVAAVWGAVFAAGLAAAAFSLRRQGLPARAALLGAALALSAPFICLGSSRFLFSRYLTASATTDSAEAATYGSILPKTAVAGSPAQVRPFSPRGISETRRIRQQAEQQAAGRRVATQLFTGLDLRTWPELLAFLPKGMFYVLFMPLPGLYALEGNLGRILASLENTVLLLLAAAAALGFWRGPKDPVRGLLLGLFLAMAAGSALLEFDLGSATRHKLLYMPLLFPFAASLWPVRPRQSP